MKVSIVGLVLLFSANHQLYALSNLIASTTQIVDAVNLRVDVWSDMPQDSSSKSSTVERMSALYAENYYPNASSDAVLNLNCDLGPSSCPQQKRACIERYQQSIQLEANFFDNCSNQVVDQSNPKLYERLSRVARAKSGTQEESQLSTVSFIGDSCQVLIGAAHGFNDFIDRTAPATVFARGRNSNFEPYIINREFSKFGVDDSSHIEHLPRRDWAILVLEKPVPNCDYFNLEPMAVSDLISLQEMVKFETATLNTVYEDVSSINPRLKGGLGSSSGKTRLQYANCSRIVENLHLQTVNGGFLHDSPSPPGSSGSPWFFEADDGSTPLVAINTARTVQSQDPTGDRYFHEDYRTDRPVANFGLTIHEDIVAAFEEVSRQLLRQKNPEVVNKGEENQGLNL